MAKIPDPNEINRVAPRPSMATASFRPGIEESAMSQFGAEVVQFAEKEREHLANASAQEASNKLQQRQLDLTLGEKGFAKRKGGEVVNTPEGGKPFVDEYKEQFVASREEITSGLSGLARTKFDAMAEALYLNFQTGLLRHSVTEADAHYKQVDDGTLRTASAMAGAGWNDKNAIKTSRQQAADVVQRKLERGELAQEQVPAAMQEAAGGVVEAVVDAALANGDARYAEKYLSENTDIPSDKLLTLNTKIQALRKQQIAFEASGKVMQRLAPKILPSELDRAMATIPGIESGGRQFGRDGKTIISPKGAVGKWQIMPGTGPDAAKAAGLKWDEKRLHNDEAYNEALGKAYFGKLLTQFDGDVEKTWAAYNWGQGNVRKAEKKAEINQRQRLTDLGLPAMTWLDFAPDETQKYVKNNKAAFESGASAPRPTLMDVKVAVQEQVLADNPRATSEQIDAAQTKAEALYNDLLATERQGQEQAFLSVQQRVDAGEVKSYHDLTPQDLALLGDKRNSVRTYIESAQGHQDKILEASPEATTKYYSLYSDSEALRAASVPEIMALASGIGKGRADDLLKRRQHFIDNPDAERAANIDSDMFKAVTQQLGMGSVGASDNTKKQLVLLEDRTKQAIIERQAEVKRPLTGDEKREIVTTMALEFPKVNVPGGGWWGGDAIKAQRGYEIKEPQNIVIPEKDKNEIAQRAKAAGVTIRNDTQWREAYRALLLERNKGT